MLSSDRVPFKSIQVTKIRRRSLSQNPSGRLSRPICKIHRKIRPTSNENGKNDNQIFPSTTPRHHLQSRERLIRQISTPRSTVVVTRLSKQSSLQFEDTSKNLDSTVFNDENGDKDGVSRRSDIHKSKTIYLYPTQSNGHRKKTSKEEEKKSHRSCYLRKPCCAILSAIIGVLLTMVISTIVIVLLTQNQPSTTSTIPMIELTTTTVLSFTSTTVSTTTSDTSTSSTSSSTTTSDTSTSSATSSTTITTTTSTSSSTSSTTTTDTSTSSTHTSSSSTSSSTSSTSTTTPNPCPSSCLNQKWISSVGLLAKWTFDGTFDDQTNTYNATPVNSPTFITNGYVNQALLLNATMNEYLYTSYIPLINTSFTIELWLYPTQFANPTDHSILGLCTNLSNNQCLHLTIRNFSGAYRLYMSFFGDNCVGNRSVSLNQWIHAAFVFDLTTNSMLIYQDGVSVGNRTSALPFQAAADNVTIGYIPGIVSSSGANFYQGYLDHLIIVNRAKPSCEILDDATLATYYNFDTNPTVVDDGPNSLSSISQNVSYVSSGHLSDAISFTRNNSVFQINDLTGLGITNKPFSISLWIRPVTLSGTLVFVENGTVGGLWCVPFLGFAVNNSLVAQMWSGGIRTVFGPVLSTSSGWHHVVQTWSSTNRLRLFVNNTLVAVNTVAGSYSASSLPNNVKLGNRPINGCSQGSIPPPYPYRGDLDDFRIYSRGLTSDDICALYNYR